MANVSVQIGDEVFNSKDVTVYWFGKIVPIKKIAGDIQKDVNPVYITGNDKPIGFTSGNQKANGSITLLLSELAGLELSLGKNVVDAPSSTITIVASKPNGVVLTKTYKTVKPTGAPHEFDGDSGDATVVNIPLFIGDITPWK